MNGMRKVRCAIALLLVAAGAWSVLWAKTGFETDGGSVGRPDEWLVSGPYPAYRADGGTQALMTDFLDGEDLAAPFPGQKATGVFEADLERLVAQIGSKNEWGFRETRRFDATWRKMQFPGDSGKNLNRRFDIIDDWFACYMCVYLDVPAPCEAVVALGADDEHKVWMDERVLGFSQTSQGVKPGQYRYSVKLGRGIHRLLVKIVDHDQDAGFSCTVTDGKGGALPGVSFLSDPRGKTLALDAVRAARNTPESIRRRAEEEAARRERLTREVAELEAQRCRTRQAEERALAAYADAIRSVETQFAAEHAAATAQAPRSTAVPLEPERGRRARLCINGLWEASVDGGRTWSPIAVPTRLFGTTYFLSWYYPMRPKAGQNRFGEYEPKPGYEDFALNPAVSSRRCRLRTAFDWDGGGEAVHYVCEGLTGGEVSLTCNGIPCGSDFHMVGITRLPLKGVRRGRNVLEFEYVHKDRFGSEPTGFVGDSFVDFLPAVRTEDVFIKTSWTKAVLAVKTELVNETASPVNAEIRTRVVEGGLVRLELPRRTCRLAAHGRLTVKTASRWADPKPWGPGGVWGDPDLYRLVTDVSIGGRVVDRHEETFGFREFCVRSTQFFLNGRNIQLQGDTGCAQNHQIHAREVFWNLLRRDGINTIRYHDSQYWSIDSVRGADRMGMLTHVQMYPRLHVPGFENASATNFMPVAEFLQTDRHRWNCENYARWFRMLRNRPSVVIWSTDNEVTTQSWDSDELEPIARRNDAVAAEYGRYVKAMDPGRVMTRDGDIGTWGRGARWQDDPPCDTANYHYPDYNPDTKILGWQQKYDWRPVVFGETLYYSYGAFDGWVGALPLKVEKKANLLRRIIPMYRRLSVPGQIYMGLSHDGFVVKGGGNAFGVTNEVWKVVDWPSDSGLGARERYVQIADGESGGRVLNWFDPRYPSHVRNAVNDAYRDCLKPQVALRMGSDAEVLVEGVAPGTDVWAEAASGRRIGVRADVRGRAWFRELEPGVYRLSDGLAEKEVYLEDRSAYAAEPGFLRVPRISLKETSTKTSDCARLSRTHEALTQEVRRRETSVGAAETAAELMNGKTERPETSGHGRTNQQIGKSKGVQK